MIVTLIETYRIFNMTLPDKVKGRFWITDVDSFGDDRKLISVEADEGSWVLKVVIQLLFVIHTIVLLMIQFSKTMFFIM